MEEKGCECRWLGGGTQSDVSGCMLLAACGTPTRAREAAVLSQRRALRQGQTDANRDPTRLESCTAGQTGSDEAQRRHSLTRLWRGATHTARRRLVTARYRRPASRISLGAPVWRRANPPSGAGDALSPRAGPPPPPRASIVAAAATASEEPRRARRCRGTEAPRPPKSSACSSAAVMASGGDDSAGPTTESTLRSTQPRLPPLGPAPPGFVLAVAAAAARVVVRLLPLATIDGPL